MFRFYRIINVVAPHQESQLPGPESFADSDLVTYCAAHESQSPAAYLAFYFDSKDYEKYKEFVLGEGQGTKCSFRKTRAISTMEYYNGPLQPGTEYKTFARGYTSEVY